MLVKIFLRKHGKNLRITHRRTGWTAYRQTVRSWKSLEHLLPPTTLEKTIPNFSKFYDLVLATLLHRHKCKLYQRNNRRIKNGKQPIKYKEFSFDKI